MPRYRFTGTNLQGQRVTGQRDAPNPDALLNAIRREVVQVDSVWPVDGGESLTDEEHIGAVSLSQPASQAHDRQSIHRADAGEISGHLAEIIGSGLPLETGLAAIAAECPSRRMRRTLGAITAELAAGSSLEAAMGACRAPAELRALVRAGARSGDTGRVLEHYVTNVQAVSELRDSIRLGFLYPLVVVLLFVSMGALVSRWIVPQFTAIFQGFDLDLPLMTQGLIVVTNFFNSSTTLWMLAGIPAFIVGIGLMLRAVLGEIGMRRLVCRIPLIGPILRWIALARFSQLLSLLVENRVPLDEALVLAGEASRDAEIKADCRRILVGVSSGETFGSAASRLRGFPASFVQALSWEGNANGLPEVLQSLGDMYAGRVRAAVAVLVAIIPPLLMVGLGSAIGLTVIALFMPLIELLNKLA